MVAIDTNTDPAGRSGPGLRVAIYLRQSDREQRLSINQQRTECRAYAQNRGWIVAAEYVDDGKSGSKELDKREAFARMIDDAERKDRTFDALLTWDTSRFGRLDSQAGAPAKVRLRKVGIWLETAKGERIDWSTSFGRMMDAMRSEADNQYSLDISRNTIRGRRAVLDLGFSPRPVPYGYDRAYFEGDALQAVIPRGKVFGKPRNWHVKPQPNEREVDVVRWVFEQWASRDMSFTGTIRELRERGTPAPGGKPSWTLHQVKRLLTERTYAGDLHVGKGCRTKEAHFRIGETVKENAIPALIDRDVWHRVQRKVKDREGAEWRPRSLSGPLSSILKCGHCGYTLARRLYNGYTYYVCDSASKRPHLGCRQWRAAEKEILPHITRELAAAIDFEVLAKLAARPEPPDAAKLDALRARERTLAGQVQRATKNLLLVDPMTFKAAQDAVMDLMREHERAANALKLADADVTDEDRRRWIEWFEGVRDTLVQVCPPADIDTKPEAIGEHLKLEVHASQREFDVEMTVNGPDAITYHRPALRASIDTFRDLMRRLNVRVDLHWTIRNPGAAQPRYRLTTGTLRAHWQPGSDAAETTLALDAEHEDNGNRARRARRAA